MLYSHSGDIGDLIFGLSLPHYTGCSKFIISKNGPQRIPIDSKLYDSLLSILERQNYIDKIIYYPREYYTPMIGFRYWMKWFSIPESHFFAYKHSREIALKHIRGNNWLTNIPKINTKKIIISKGFRYWSPNLPLELLLKLFRKDECGFVGYEEEYNAFRSQFNFNIDYVKTDNLLDLASHINSANLFIGSASSPAAIAQALGTPAIILVRPPLRKAIDFQKGSTFIIDNGTEDIIRLFMFLNKYNINSNIKELLPVAI